MAVKRTPAEVANIIEQFLEGTGGQWDWDDFCSIRIADPELDRVRLSCCVLSEKYPATEKSHYCSNEGFEVMRRLITELRSTQG